MRRIEGVGKEIRESVTGGGGVVNWFGWDILLVLESEWKTRTGHAVRERA